MPVSDKKRAYAERLRALLEHNKSVIIVHCDNVGSRQMQQIRIALRGTATVAMGKNTTIRKVRGCGGPRHCIVEPCCVVYTVLYGADWCGCSPGWHR